MCKYAKAPLNYRRELSRFCRRFHKPTIEYLGDSGFYEDHGIDNYEIAANTHQESTQRKCDLVLGVMLYVGY